MNDRFRCGSDERLVSYLYDECEAAERAAVAAHLAACPDCAQALAALSDTRQLLAAWTPPEVNADWRLSGEDAFAGADGPSQRARRTLPPATAWWRQPLPAWAQAAAAVLIFAAGLAIGGSRSDPAPAASGAPDLRPAMAALHARVEVMERSSSGFETALAALAAQAEPLDPVPAVMSQVRREIAAIEARMRGEVAIGFLQMKREDSQLQQSLSEDVNQLKYVTTQLVARE